MDNMERMSRELEELREVVKFAAKNFSTCMYRGGCLPRGARPRPKSDWCAHCRLIHASNKEMSSEWRYTLY